MAFLLPEQTSQEQSDHEYGDRRFAARNGIESPTSTFQAGTSCILNDLTGLGGLRKFLKGRERQIYLGWNSWV